MRISNCNKGVSPVRMAIVLASVFALTVIFVGFDNVIGSTLPDKLGAIAPSRTENINQYVNGWRIMVPSFLIAMLIYILIAGLSPRETRGI